MLFRLALRNVVKTLPKRLVFGSFFAATMALLFLGNTAFENSDRGLAATYVNSFTAQASLSAPSPEQFTIFGSDLPLIGEFLVLPVLPDVAGLVAAVSQTLPHAQTLPQVSALASLSIRDYLRNVPVFGVEFSEYFRFFPALRLVSGTLPRATDHAVLLTRFQADEVAKSLGRPLVPGDKLLLEFLVRNSTVTREVVFAGSFEYPVADDILQRIVLTDPDTARALDGYLYGGAPASTGSSPIDTNLDSEFDQVGASAVTAPEANLPKASVAGVPAAPSAGTTDSGAGAWNFLLVRDPGRTDQALVDDLRRMLAGRTTQVRDWRDTAGGNAQIAWFLRILFNLGLVFIAFVSCLILINSLSLSILERTREIGTMRALGAERSFVGGLIAWETLILVTGMGLVGILAGVLATQAINGLHITVNNVYISSLFGSEVLRIDPSWSGILMHGALGLLLGMVSVIFPVQKALDIQPVKAIARDQ